jgi:hypothetical protein
MIDIFLSILSLPLVILLSTYPYILFGVLSVLLIILYRLYPQSILFYIVCGIGGPLAESLAIKYGVKTWNYKEPTEPLNIPLWLIPLWAIAGIFILRVSKILN